MANLGNTLRRALLTAAIAVMGAIGALSASGSVHAQTLALVQINQQALFFNQLNDGAMRAAKAAGAELL